MPVRIRLHWFCQNITDRGRRGFSGRFFSRFKISLTYTVNKKVTLARFLQSLLPLIQQHYLHMENLETDVETSPDCQNKELKQPEVNSSSETAILKILISRNLNQENIQNSDRYHEMM